MPADSYMAEWSGICAAYARKVGAELVFVKVDSFGLQFPDGSCQHIYADELEQLLKGAEVNG